MNNKTFILFLFIVLLFGLFFILTKNENKNNLQPQSNITTSISPIITPIFGKRTKTAGCVAVNGLPDKECTPGEIDLRVTQDTIKQTICVKGYTKTVRPPANYTNKLKIEQINEYGYADTNPKDYEEDHLIPLELGGNPTSEANLWPETYYSTPGSHEKDKIENYLHVQVCAGNMSLQDAQVKIATNWVEIYNTYLSK